MQFHVKGIVSTQEYCFPLCILEKEYWNDRGYISSFKLYYVENIEEYKSNDWYYIGQTKIGKKGMKHNTNKPYLDSTTRTDIPDDGFEMLGEEYFSLGQSETYYDNLNSLGKAITGIVLGALNDIVFNVKIYEKYQDEYVMRKSLKRYTSEKTIKGQYRRIITGESKLTPFEFEYTLRNSENNSMSFVIEPNSLPRSNIQVIIGKNGVGKTHLLSDMIENIVYQKKQGTGFFTSKNDVVENLFSNVIGISFSVFENNMLNLSLKEENQKIPYTFIGLQKNIDIAAVENLLNNKFEDKSEKENAIKDFLNNSSKRFNDINYLADYFTESLKNILLNDFKRKQWEIYIKILEEDPSFEMLNIIKIVDEFSEDNIKEYFKIKLSSGHKIVLLIITKLSEVVEEKTLVLFDEPENHLHPLLLSLLFKAMNKLLVYRNCVALLATHSPIVLQEVPKKATWILRRIDKQLTFRRPRIETFGENIGILNQEVFKIDVTRTGYYTLIKESIEDYESVEDVFHDFKNQLGSEGKEIVKHYIYQNSEGH